MTDPQKLSPAPGVNAGDRAKGHSNISKSSTKRACSEVNFAVINAAAIAALPAVLVRILPGGHVNGRERSIRHAPIAARARSRSAFGARAGAWSAFAAGGRGADPVSLVAYLEAISQGEAARMLAKLLGLKTGGRGHG